MCVGKQSCSISRQAFYSVSTAVGISNTPGLQEGVWVAMVRWKGASRDLLRRLRMEDALPTDRCVLCVGVGVCVRARACTHVRVHFVCVCVCGETSPHRRRAE